METEIYCRELEAEYRRKVGNREGIKYLRRKLQLMLRDPLGKELANELEGHVPEEDFSDKILALKKKLSMKWGNVSILFTDDQKYYYAIAMQPYEDILDPEGKYPFSIRPGRHKFIEPVSFHRLNPAEKPKTYIIECVPAEDKLIIEVDLNLVDSQDKIKDKLWEIVSQYVVMKRQEKKPKYIIGEPPELQLLYRCKEDTFNNYLKWYDLHMPAKGKGLSFREIARQGLLDTISREAPGKLKEISQEIMKFKILNKNTQKTIQKLIGKKIKIIWEDAIETAVKKIYEAIHRKPYPSRKKAKLFDICPVHGEMSKCPTDCKYLIADEKIFNNRHPENKRQLDTLEDLESKIADPKGMQTPAKGKASKMAGKQKKQELEGKKHFPKVPL